MGKSLAFAKCNDTERAAVEELIEGYHRGDISSLDMLSNVIREKVGIQMSKSTLRRIFRRMFGEEETGKDDREKVLAELFDQYKRGEKCSWRQMAIRAREAGVSTSKSTLFRKFKKEQNDEHKISTNAEMDDGEQPDGPFVKRISLSRHLKATLMNIYENGDLRQYSLIRGNVYSGRQYYRCTGCAEWKRKRNEGKIAYVSVMNGKVIAHSGAHHSNCEPLDENKVFAKAIDRQCRLDIRRGGANPRLSYTKGVEQMMCSSLNACSYFPRWNAVRRAYYRHRTKGTEQTSSPSPASSSDQTTVDEEVKGITGQEDREALNLRASSSESTTSIQKLSVQCEDGRMRSQLDISEHKSKTGDDLSSFMEMCYGESSCDHEEGQPSTSIRESSTFVIRRQQVGTKPAADRRDYRRDISNYGRVNSQLVGVGRQHRGRQQPRIAHIAGSCLQRRIRNSEESSKVEELLTEIRALKATVRQHENRIHQLEEQLIDKKLL